MKNKKLQPLTSPLNLLDTVEEQQVKGGYGRIIGTRVPARTSRWDDIPFRRANFRHGDVQEGATLERSELGKGSLLRP